MPRHCSLRAATQAAQPFSPSRCPRRTPKTRWIIESIAIPMQTLVAGAEIIDDLETIFITIRFDHSKQEHRVGAILGYKAFRHPGILGLLHHLRHLFVAHQE